MKRAIEVFGGDGVDEVAIEGFAAGPIHRAKTFFNHLNIFKPNYGEVLQPHGVGQQVPFDAFTIILSGDTIDFEADLDKLYVCPRAFNFNENIVDGSPKPNGAAGSVERSQNYNYAMKHWFGKPGVVVIKNSRSGLMNDGIRGIAISVHLDDFEVWDKIARVEEPGPFITATQKPRKAAEPITAEDMADSFEQCQKMKNFGFVDSEEKPDASL